MTFALVVQDDSMMPRYEPANLLLLIRFTMITLREIKSIAMLALPLMTAFLAQKGMQFIDTFMMGWIGPEALAAGALGTSIFFTVLVFCMGVLSAAGIFIVRAKGANDDTDMQSSLQHALCLSLILAIPCMMVIHLAPRILSMIGQDPVIINNTILLLSGLVWGLPGYLLFMVLREYIAAFSLTRIVMLVALGSIPLTFIANYIFIYGVFDFPKLGIAGIGYAGAMIMWFMFLCLYLYCIMHSELQKYISFRGFQLNLQKLFDILHVGVPSGMLYILESGMFLIAAVLMGYLGVDALAAHQIALQCVSIAYAIPFALSMTTALQVGHAAGAGDIQQARRSAFNGLTLGLILTAIIACIFVLLPAQIIKLFLHGTEHDYEVISQLAISYLFCAAVFQCFDGFQAIANGALRGLKDTFVPMLLSIACYWILGVCSAYYFAFYTNLKSLGVWYGLTLGIVSIGVILLLRLINKLKRELKKSIRY